MISGIDWNRYLYNSSHSFLRKMKIYAKNCIFLSKICICINIFLFNYKSNKMRVLNIKFEKGNDKNSDMLHNGIYDFIPTKGGKYTSVYLPILSKNMSRATMYM